MKPHAIRCKCLHCKRIFVPDYRNRGRQRYCSTPECQAASKQASQRQCLSKPDNRDYFRGSENVQRVQQWRAGIQAIGSGGPASHAVCYKRPARRKWLQMRRFLRHGEPAAWALYLVLVIVADAQGLSYYSEATFSRLLKLELVLLAQVQNLFRLAFLKDKTNVIFMGGASVWGRHI